MQLVGLVVAPVVVLARHCCIEGRPHRNAGDLPGVTPVARLGGSLHDNDARPIAKGRLGKPVEFGHKVQVADNEDGVVLDYTVEPGNPADAPRLQPAVERIKQRNDRPSRNRHRRPWLRREADR